MELLLTRYLVLIIGVLFISLSIAANDEKSIRTNNSDKETSVTILSRAVWGARAPVEPPTPLEVQPVPYAVVIQTATESCPDIPECFLIVRKIQDFHIESRGWNDIAYNFLIGGDGTIFEGRGWDVQGAHTLGYNNRSVGIGLIGSFNSVKPTEAQILATKKLLELGVSQNKLSEDYKVLGQIQFYLAGNGKKLLDIIKTWSRWTTQP